ncbi:MAG: hypothetical protein ABJD07_04755 [Gemmatimonadaceae bacterium]
MPPDNNMHTGVSACFPSPEALGALRVSIAGYLRTPTSDDDACAWLDFLVNDAHAQGAPAERALIVFKDAWRDVAEQTGGVSRDRNDQLARLASLCIDRFYRAH